LTGVKLGTAKITVGLATSATDVTTTGYAVKSDALTVTVGGSTTEQAGVVVTTDKQVYTPGSYAYVTVKAVDKDGKTLSPRPSADKYTVFATGGISASLPIETVTGIISAVDFVPAARLEQRQLLIQSLLSQVNSSTRSSCLHTQVTSRSLMDNCSSF
jgi:hypothetical protein